MKTQGREQAMWRAVMARDAASDGLFVFGVRTTGVFCRPSCCARHPRRENVEFFADAALAEQRGFRACQRCRPKETLDPRASLCRQVLSHVTRQRLRRWSDVELKASGFCALAVRRAFVANFGHTFQAHMRSLRAEQACADLQRGAERETAAARAGFESDSGLRAAMRATGAVRRGLLRGKLWHALIPTPLGKAIAAATDEGVCWLWFQDPENSGAKPARKTQAILGNLAGRLDLDLSMSSHAHLELLEAELAAYFSGELQEFRAPLDLHGSEFERAVWRCVQGIPHGSTASYGEIARQLGRPQSARAVGRANACNPVAILVPCHRVIASTGALTGYVGGLTRKRWLLERERQICVS